MGTTTIAAGTAAVLLLCSAPAFGAFPGGNGRIAYQGYQSLGTINATGGERTPLIAESGSLFGSPAWSPDGRRLAFTTNRDGNLEIYVTGPTGTPLTRLTNHPADDSSPAWSPDGARIVFESDRDTGGTGRTQIHVMNADGTGVTNLSPSLQDDRTPSWSPDGTRIAFARGPQDGNHDIWSTAGTGGPGAPLTNSAIDEDNPDWSPDGTRIVFERDGALVVMGAGGGGQTPLPSAGQRPAWSPDGTRIVYDVAPELFSVKPDGTDVQQLTFGGSVTLFSQSPSWQPVPPPPAAGPVTPPAPQPAPPPVVVDPGGERRLRVVGSRIDAITATYPRGYMTFTRITVTSVRKGDRLRLSCKGRGCPFARRTVKVRKAARKLSLLRHLRGAKLRKGAVVQLRVIRPGTIGRVRTWTVRAPKIPRITDRCLRPGAKRPGRCPR